MNPDSNSTSWDIIMASGGRAGYSQQANDIPPPPFLFLPHYPLSLPPVLCLIFLILFLFCLPPDSHFLFSSLSSPACSFYPLCSDLLFLLNLTP